MKGNSPLEVMAAIVANGGPVECYAGSESKGIGITTWFGDKYVSGVDINQQAPFSFTDGSRSYLCSITNPHKQYKPIPTEWTHDWAECRAVDSDGELWEYESNASNILRVEKHWARVRNDDLRFTVVSTGHDPTGWCNSLEQRTRKMRHMTPLEAFEFLAEGHEGKPRVWQGSDMNPGLWLCSDAWDWSCLPEFAKYSNLSDRDGDTLIWREFPQVKDN